MNPYQVPCGEMILDKPNVISSCNHAKLCPACQIIKELVEACQLGLNWAVQAGHWRGSEKAIADTNKIAEAICHVTIQQKGPQQQARG